MAFLLGKPLTGPPLCIITIPGKFGPAVALIAETLMPILMMGMILITSDHPQLKKYTRLFSGLFVCLFVTFGASISGFEMNPAGSFVSAFAANRWDYYWIYLILPILGMQ